MWFPKPPISYSEFLRIRKRQNMDKEYPVKLISPEREDKIRIVLLGVLESGRYCNDRLQESRIIDNAVERIKEIVDYGKF